MEEFLGREDRRARLEAWRVYRAEVSRWGRAELLKFIDRTTGGLGYTKEEPFDVVRMGLAGSAIAWAEAVRDGDTVLEVGTGIGRTCYCATYSAVPALYVTVEVSVGMLAVALYANPVEAYRRALWNPFVRTVLADARDLVPRLPPSTFDHIIHDGGPNPSRNPALFSEDFLAALARVLRPGGRIPVFAGRDPAWQERIYRALRGLGLRVVGTVPLPFSRARAIRAVKPG